MAVLITSNLLGIVALAADKRAKATMTLLSHTGDCHEATRNATLGIHVHVPIHGDDNGE